MPISITQLKFLWIAAMIFGIYGIAVFTQTNSPIFLFASIANLALAAFFWYKYRVKNRPTSPKKGKKV
ncbi:MAG: hypothetical protein WB501_08980 [Nitrososphaeraceae archaeon]|nr:hypothetical protein [Nitrososphaeraceae archaeon]MDW0168788.1 hypothetical protein [Nitrososphaeraceae archaeon]MDW0171731.1 hypothetical protein [Nitrososphaeraceae archaeon]MDW0172996.1 hypothetical protein [Nitrososphaeraceae archaeon]MDW0178705.1 hypothetical protein [Nitrososphaeraceae archaeon]